MSRDVETDRLIREGQSGNSEAIDKLIRKYAADVHRLIYSIMGNSDRVPDLAQETFLRIFSRLDQYRFQSSFRAWIIQIAVNLCRDEFRKARVRKIISPLFPDSEDYIHSDDPDMQPDFKLERNETRQQIINALQTLDKSLRLVFTLREIEGLPYEEIARILNWRLGTVKSRLFRARKELAGMLSDQLEDL